MKTNKLFFGVFFLVIGVLFLLNNLFSINFSFSAVFKFWPLVLILFGLSFFSAKEIIKTIISVIIGAFLGYLVFTMFTTKLSCASNLDIFDEVDHISIDTLSYPANKGIENLELSLDIGAAKIDVVKAENEKDLYRIIGNKLVDNYEITDYFIDNKAIVKIHNKEDNNSAKIHFKARKFELALNKNLVYNLTLKTGLTKSDIDLSELKVNNLVINSGASKFNLKVPEPYADTLIIDINMGVTKANLLVPQNSGIKIYSDMALSDTNFPDFYFKPDKKEYESKNFEKEKKRIIFRINGGVSKINMEKY